jgi:hypothetical protein
MAAVWPDRTNRRNSWKQKVYKVTIDTRHRMDRWTTLQDAFQRVCMLTGGASDTAIVCAFLGRRSRHGIVFSRRARPPSEKARAGKRGTTSCKRPSKQGAAQLVHNAAGTKELDGRLFADRQSESAKANHSWKMSLPKRIRILGPHRRKAGAIIRSRENHLLRLVTFRSTKTQKAASSVL